MTTKQFISKVQEIKKILQDRLMPELGGLCILHGYEYEDSRYLDKGKDKKERFDLYICRDCGNRKWLSQFDDEDDHFVQVFRIPREWLKKEDE